jgi:hypothetical protein
MLKYFAVFIILFASCANDKNKPDVSHIKKSKGTGNQEQETDNRPFYRRIS